MLCTGHKYDILSKVVWPSHSQSLLMLFHQWNILLFRLSLNYSSFNFCTKLQSILFNLSCEEKIVLTLFICGSLFNSPNSLRHVTKKQTSHSAGGAGDKVSRSQKSLGVIFWGPWMTIRPVKLKWISPVTRKINEGVDEMNYIVPHARKTKYHQWKPWKS